MVVSTTSTTITLSWEPPESLGGRTDLTYVISYQDSQDSTVSLQVNVTIFTITGNIQAITSTCCNLFFTSDLLPGMQYFLAVRAENGVSPVANVSSNAGTVTVTVLLGKICSSIATASDVVIVCMHAVYYSSYVILQTPCPPLKWH